MVEAMINYFLAWLFTLVMLVPFGIAAMYAVIALRQWMTGNKENSQFKTAGAIKALSIALVAMALVAMAWWFILRNIAGT